MGMIHARQGEGRNEGKHKRRRQGYDMARGKSILRGGTLQEVGSANSSELEARPNGGQKRKAKCIGGFWRQRSTAETAPIEGAGIAFLRRNPRRRQIAFLDRYMGQSAAANCGGERGLASAAAKKHTDATRPLNSRLGLSAKCQHESADKLGCNDSTALRKDPWPH